MTRDTTQWLTMARIDNATRRNKVYAARRLIYEKQYRVNATAIEDLLKDQSLVPTAVCLSQYSRYCCVTYCIILECLLR